MPQVTISTKFWTISQNNSGGRLDHDAKHGIGYALCVEATDHNDAHRRLKAITDGYGASGSCPCCGDRWDLYLDADEGTEEPELYGEPLKGSWGIPSYVHRIDGSIVELPA